MNSKNSLKSRKYSSAVCAESLTLFNLMQNFILYYRFATISVEHSEWPIKMPKSFMLNSCQFCRTHSIPLCLCPLSPSMVPAPLSRLFHGTLLPSRNIQDAFSVSVLRNFPAKSKKIKVRSTLIPPTSRLTNLILARISRKHIFTFPYSGVFGPFLPPLTPPPPVRTPLPPYFRFRP